MNSQDETPPITQSVDQSRRRLTKVGLAAPAVLGVLASRPVLGQSLHHCTPSGYISGFASPPPTGATPCNLGQSVDYYAGDLENWPEQFLGTNKKPLLFRESPAKVGALFEDAYERVVVKDNKTTTEPATVWDVLKGYAVDKDGLREGHLKVVDNYSSNVDLELGQLAVAVCMNALGGGGVTKFPIGAKMVVNMFNGVLINGADNVTSTNNWNMEHLKDYFETLLR